jgi:hypothetical protein
MWIGDMGATQHMTASKLGATNVHKASNTDKVSMGNGQVKKTSEICDIPGVVCDKNGHKVSKQS